ncbi:MAG: hypothetical protein AAGA47_12385, partial [Pseudomonadota bacterium]
MRLDDHDAVIEKVRSVTDKPISHLVLTHYHAVRVLGASAYGAGQVIMSEKARAMVAERGAEDWASEFERFPRLFEGHESIPGLTWPTTTFNGRAISDNNHAANIPTDVVTTEVINTLEAFLERSSEPHMDFTD